MVHLLDAGEVFPLHEGGPDGAVQEPAGLLARFRERAKHAGGARDESEAP